MLRYNDACMPLERITLFCFEASYLVALVLEFMQLFQPRPILRLGGMVFGSAGLLAHTLFLLYQPLSLSSQFGSLIFLAWRFSCCPSCWD
jgi:hypothetical protein